VTFGNKSKLVGNKSKLQNMHETSIFGNFFMKFIVLRGGEAWNVYKFRRQFFTLAHFEAVQPRGPIHKRYFKFYLKLIVTFL